MLTVVPARTSRTTAAISPQAAQRKLTPPPRTCSP